jgi:uncharacterized protein (DUF427 family)
MTHSIEIEPCPKRVRVSFNGTTIADSLRVLLLRETGYRPVYYFPRDDLRMDLMRRTAHATHCPYKGDAAYWTLSVGARSSENAAWSYETPSDGVKEIAEHLAFYWDRVDAWHEEDEQVFVHARDPKVRIDILDSRRRVRVLLGGETLADSRRARFLFETGHPTRYYLPRADVRMERLTPSDTRTPCPYKGQAVYWTARIGAREVPDIVWSYPEPYAEVGRIKDHLCFYPEKVDAIEVETPALVRGPMPRVEA